MKEAALWLDEHERDRDGRAIVYPHRGYIRSMEPWHRAGRARRPEDAEYLVRYRSESVRGLWVKPMRPFVANARPLASVTLDGRVFVEIFAGPKYRGP